MRTRRSSTGFSLIDVMVVLAIVGIVASMALPSFQSQLAKGRRADAVAALTRLQMAQEQHRALHGSYALAPGALGRAAAPTSDQGFYAIHLVAADPQGYIARARSLEVGALDGGCQEMTLSVSDGVATHGPSARCWNR